MASRNDDVDNVERLEAECRVICWQHSQIPHPDIYVPGSPRADRARERDRLHREFDTVVDRWAMSRLIQAIARISQDAS